MLAHARRAKLKLNGLFPKGIIQGTTYTFNYGRDISSECCVYCGKASDSWEHVVPKSEGGSNGFLNLVRACHECNQSRGSKPFLLWMLTRDVPGVSGGA